MRYLLAILLLIPGLITPTHGQHPSKDKSVRDHLNAKPLPDSPTTPGYVLINGVPDDPSRIIQSFSDSLHIIYVPAGLSPSSHSNLYSINNNWKIADGLSLDLQPLILYFRKKTDATSYVAKHHQVKLLHSNTVAVPSGNPSSLMHDERITFISPYYKAKEESLLPFFNHGLNRIASFQTVYPSLDGADQVLSIKESAYNHSDPDLAGRTIVLTGDEITLHATEMATLAGGSGLLSPRSIGVSPQVGLTQASFSSLFAESTAYYDGVSVQNHSYGTSPEPFYGPEAASYDQSVIDKNTLIHVFSAGNAGLSTVESGPYAGIQGYNTLTGNFKNAKNILTVSSTDDQGVVLPQNSRGPTFDGRIRPELVAYGEGGTSDAAALVSGAAIGLSSLYRSKNGTPLSFPLFRALIIASSDDTGTSGPDYRSGYGTMNMIHAAKIIENEQYFEGLSEEGSLNHTVTIPESTYSLRMVLTWLEPPSNPGDQQVLIHDLDISLIDPDGQVHLPWVLSSYPHKDSLELAARKGVDHKNTQELISLVTPVSGEYTINISAPGSDVPFALAWHLEPANGVVWRYPLAGSTLIRNQLATVYWDTTLKGSGTIEWINGSGQWNTLTSVLLENEVAQLPLPDTSGVLQVRLKHDGLAYASEKFTLSLPPQPSVDFNCPEEWQVSWPPVENATSYQIRGVVNNQLQLLTTTGETTLSSNSLEYTGRLLSVQAVIDDLPAQRALTFDITTQGVGCYLSGFTGLALENRIQLNFQIGTTEGIDQLEILRLNDGVIIYSTDIVSELLFQAYDDQPLSRINRYQISITLEDGRQFLSDTLEILYSEAGEVLIYPNPVKEGQVLTVVTRDPEVTVEIMDALGQIVAVFPLTLVREEFLIPLARGIYLLRVRTENQLLSTQRIIVY